MAGFVMASLMFSSAWLQSAAHVQASVPWAARRASALHVMSAADDRVRDVTLSWVERAVVGLNLCPYAEAPLRSGAIRVVVSSATDEVGLLADTDEQCALLLGARKEDVATTLLVAPNLPLSFLEFANEIGALEDEDVFAESFPAHADKVMVVCFHPEHAWAGLADDDPVNYEKRSPWPIVNLLRTEMVDSAIATGKTVDIGARNEARLRREGIAVVREIYARLFREASSGYSGRGDAGSQSPPGPEPPSHYSQPQ